MLLMTPGPTRVPERGAARRRAADAPPPQPGVLARARRAASSCLRPLFGTRERRAARARHRPRRDGGDALQSVLARRRDRRLLQRPLRRDVGRDRASSYGLVVHRLATDWNRDVDPAEVERVLDAHPAMRGVALAHSDTSTGVANDVAGDRARRARDAACSCSSTACRRSAACRSRSTSGAWTPRSPPRRSA